VISAGEHWNLTPKKIMSAYSVEAAWYFALILLTAGNLLGAICIAAILLLAGSATAALSRMEGGWTNER
jgi:hypothetical protein